MHAFAADEKLGIWREESALSPQYNLFNKRLRI